MSKHKLWHGVHLLVLSLPLLFQCLQLLNCIIRLSLAKLNSCNCTGKVICSSLA